MLSHQVTDPQRYGRVDGAGMKLKYLWEQPASGRLPTYSLAAFYVALFVFWIAISQAIYNGPVGAQTGRLDTTLGLWFSAPVSKHWFLFFLTPEDASNGVPYTNMPYLFTFFYATYHLLVNALTFGRWPFATTYLMTMMALCAGSWFVMRPALESSSVGKNLIILPLAAGMLVSSPFVTTFLLQANHDTSFPFNAIASTILAFAAWYPIKRTSPIVWIALVYCSFSGLLGLVTLACCFMARRSMSVSNNSFAVLLGLGVLNLLLPMVLAQLAFGQTSASGLFFRMGLDGSTQYFTSHWQAIFDPYLHMRSIDRELSVKFLVCITLLSTGWLIFRANYVRELTAVSVALIPYLSHWVVFPQSLSIHPYLYDMLFLIPFDIGLVVLAAGVLSRFKSFSDELPVAVVLGAVALLIHDNLLLLAQGNLLGI